MLCMGLCVPSRFPNFDNSYGIVGYGLHGAVVLPHKYSHPADLSPPKLLPNNIPTGRLSSTLFQ